MSLWIFEHSEPLINNLSQKFDVAEDILCYIVRGKNFLVLSSLGFF